MNLKHLLFTSAIALPALALAVPADPGVTVVTNPDGTTLEIQLHGDESFNYATDASGKYIMEKDSRGYWRVASRNGKSLSVSAANIKSLYGDRDDRMFTPLRDTHVSGMSRMPRLNYDGTTPYKTIGSPRSLVILVEFSDVKFTVPNIKEQITKMLTQEGYSDYGSCGSALDYFKTASNGKFTPQFEVSDVVTLKNTAKYYGQKDGNTQAHTKIGELINEACTALDEKIDFSVYDDDNDGAVDNIYFIYAGNGAADTGDRELIWPHNSSYYNYVRYYGCPSLVCDGKSILTYAIGNELKAPSRCPQGATQPWLDGIGTFCHEYGHVLGLPDLYDAYATSSTDKTPSPLYYDIMDQGSYNLYSTCPPGYSAYEKFVCKWLEYTDLLPTDKGTYELPAHSDGKTATAYRIRIPDLNWRENRPSYNSEYFVIEARADEGWDQTVPEHGILIWDVVWDQASWYANKVNTGGRQRLRMMPVEKGATQRTDKNAWGISDAGRYTFPNSDNAIIPQNKGNMLETFGVYLQDIEYDAAGKAGKFGFNLVTEAPSIPVTLHYPRKVKDKNELYLYWEPANADGVQPDGYKVTVTRKDSKGTVRVVDGCDGKDVGKETSLYVRNFNNNAIFAQECTVFVQAYKDHMDAQETSQVYTFFPPELKDYDPADPSGVEVVENVSGSNIFGGNGFIVAPEEAQVYTVSGVPCGRENLPAGIYIVTFNGHTSKVVVK